jgi:hypothetical protein
MHRAPKGVLFLYMAQPVAAGQFTSITGVGTTVLTDRSDAQLIRVVIPGTYVGTVGIFDSATAAGTAAGNLIVSLGLPTTGIPSSIEVGARTRNGLTYAATGTPVMTLIWD